MQRFGIALAIVGLVLLGISPIPGLISAKAAGISASIDQCRNGGLTPTFTPVPCVGSNAASVTVAIAGINGGTATAYKSWQNGDAQGTQAHWREGEFITYRAQITGIAAGSYTLYFNYDSVHSGGHAIDYLGSYDDTETTSPTPTSANGQIIHANNNSPCADLVAASEMNTSYCSTTYNSSHVQTSPAVPVSTAPIPATNIKGLPATDGTGGETGCGSSTGTFTGTQKAGTIDLFGPASSTIGPMTYVTVPGTTPSAGQNIPSGTNTCTTNVGVTFSVPSAIGSGDSIVIAWGGHIASQQDWGVGNSASFINGSPYHMSLAAIADSANPPNITTIGSQDRQLATSAIFFTPTVSTTVFVNGAACTTGPTTPTNVCGPVALGSSVFDTVTLNNAAATAGGTVTYTLYSNTTCTAGTGNVISTQTVNVSNDVVPNSDSFTPAAGSYSYSATYSGDGIDIGPVTGPCEPFTVQSNKPPISTVAQASTSGTVGIAMTVGDQVTVQGVDGLVPTGNGTTTGVTFTLLKSDCSTVAIAASALQALTSNGTTPASSSATYSTTWTPPAAGSYYWVAHYTGDSNYSANTSACPDPNELVTIAKQLPPIATTAQPSTSVTVGVPTTVGDKATVTGNGSVVPTGDGSTTGITFTLYASNCTTVVISTSPLQAMTSNGTTPASASATYSTSWTPSATGTYYWVAHYTGDTNYSPNTSACPDTAEKVTVVKATPPIATTAQNTTSGSVGVPITVGDKATVTGNDGVVPTGDGSTTGVTFTLYESDCTTAVVGPSSLQALTSNGTTPASASATFSTSWTPQISGTYYWVAHYTGDTNYNANTSACPDSNEQVFIGTATPPIATTAQNTTSGAVGVAITVGDKATVTGNDGVVPTGNGTTTGVTFTLYKSDCTTVILGPSGLRSLSSNNTTPSSASATYSTSWTPQATGTYYWVATYTGDGNYNANTSTCPDAAEKVVIGPVAPPIATTAQNTTTATVGIAITVGDKATVTGNDGVVPTGDGSTTGVSFTLFASDCSTVVIPASTLRALTSNNTTPSSASATYSTTWTPTAVGTYYWVAGYTGDSNYNANTSGCPDSAEKVTITPQTPPIATTAQNTTSGTVGLPITVGDKATVTGNDGVVPTGNGTTTGVTFTLYAANCTTVVISTSPLQALTSNGTTPASSSATYSTSWTPQAVGTYYWVAHYNGDSNYTPATSACPDAAEKVTVTPATPPIATKAQNTTAGTVGVPITVGDKATVTGNDGVVPTGDGATTGVTFTLYTANCTTAVIGPSALAALSSNGTTPASASATYSTSWTPEAVGTYYWVATYTGDSNYNANTSVCPDSAEQVVIGTQTPPIVTTAQNTTSGTVGLPITVGDKATVTGNDGVVPTGNGTTTGVTFTLYAADCSTVAIATSGLQALTSNGTTPSSASATYSTSWTPPAVGSYYWVATYTGDSNYTANTSACPDSAELVTVTPQTPPVTTAAQNARTGTVGLAITVGDKAAVRGNDGVVPTGNGTTTGVTFTLFASDCTTVVLSASPLQALTSNGTTPASASATYSTTWTPQATGTYYWVAHYTGDVNYNASTSACPDEAETVIIGLATPPITTTAQTTTSGIVGIPITVGDKATVTGNDGVVPTGNGSTTGVTFTLLKSDCATAAINTSPLQALSNNHTTPASASATYSTTWTPQATGTYYWVAHYTGDTNYKPVTSGCPDDAEKVTINPATPGVPTVAQPATSGTVGLELTVGDKVTVNGNDGVVPTGNGTTTGVTFTLVAADCKTVVIAASPLQTLTDNDTTPASASATFTTTWTPTAAGTYYWVASYTGDSNYNANTSSCPDSTEKVTVNPATPPVATVAQPSTNGTAGVKMTVGDKATVTGNDDVIPTGDGTTTGVTFTLLASDCTTVVIAASPLQKLTDNDTTPASATATFSTTWTPQTAGTYYWVATYTGDANYNASTSACPDTKEAVSITAAPPAVVVQAISTPPTGVFTFFTAMLGIILIVTGGALSLVSRRRRR